jgi:hypothetical protein
MTKILFTLLHLLLSFSLRDVAYEMYICDMIDFGKAFSNYLFDRSGVTICTRNFGFPGSLIFDNGCISLSSVSYLAMQALEVLMTRQTTGSIHDADLP